MEFCIIEYRMDVTIIVILDYCYELHVWECRISNSSWTNTSMDLPRLAWLLAEWEWRHTSKSQELLPHSSWVRYSDYREVGFDQPNFGTCETFWNTVLRSAVTRITGRKSHLLVLLLFFFKQSKAKVDCCFTFTSSVWNRWCCAWLNLRIWFHHHQIQCSVEAWKHQSTCRSSWNPNPSTFFEKYLHCLGRSVWNIWCLLSLSVLKILPGPSGGVGLSISLSVHDDGVQLLLLHMCRTSAIYGRVSLFTD